MWLNLEYALKAFLQFHFICSLSMFGLITKEVAGSIINENDQK